MPYLQEGGDVSKRGDDWWDAVGKDQWRYEQELKDIADKEVVKQAAEDLLKEQSCFGLH
jgi:hypothetical protein